MSFLSSSRSTHPCALVLILGLAKHTVVNADLLSQNVALMQLLHIRKIDIVQNKQCGICSVQPSITSCAHCSRQACVSCLETHRQEVVGDIARETVEIERMSEELKQVLNQSSNEFRDQCDETFQQANKRYRCQPETDESENVVEGFSRLDSMKCRRI